MKKFPARYQCLLVLMATFLFLGCSTFRGPGELQGPEELELLDPGPTVSLRGDRQTYYDDATVAFDWPVDEARLTRGMKFGRRPHWGLDLAAPRGTPIVAAEKGVVIYTGRGFRGYGNMILIEHGEEWATLYAHLDKIQVNEGQVIERGEQIGLMGATGRARGVHLHFEIRRNRQPVNPLAYLPQGFDASPRVAQD